MCGRIVIYVIGRSKEVGGKLVVPTLVLVHVFMFVYIGWEAAGDTSSLQAGFAGAFLLAITVVVTPFTILSQIYAQGRELRKMRDFGALSFPSFSMQAAVMTMIALRHFIVLWTVYPGWVDDASYNLFLRCLANLLAFYIWFFVPVSYFIWAGGALMVYFITRTGRMRTVGGIVELGVYKD
jgi:hypothetical protein